MTENVISSFGRRPNGALVKAFASNVGRGNTSASAMFTLPAGSTILAALISGTVASDASTSARISIQSSGGIAKEFLADFNVKTNGAAQSFPSSFKLGTISPATNPTTLTATYAEDGSGSSTGGPWTITVLTIDN
jgi:hypothetical protein